MAYCESIYFRGLQFSWIRENKHVHGFLISWFFQFADQLNGKFSFRWAPNFVVCFIHDNHENWYPKNNNTFTVFRCPGGKKNMSSLYKIQNSVLTCVLLKVINLLRRSLKEMSFEESTKNYYKCSKPENVTYLFFLCAYNQKHHKKWKKLL